MSDRFPGELEWTDALQAGRTEPTYPLREFMRETQAALAERDQRIGNQEIEIARLTTLVAEGERREALLREWVIARKAAVNATAATWYDVEMRWRDAEDALTDAGFTPDGWTEGKP